MHRTVKLLEVGAHRTVKLLEVGAHSMGHGHYIMAIRSLISIIIELLYDMIRQVVPRQCYHQKPFQFIVFIHVLMFVFLPS